MHFLQTHVANLALSLKPIHLKWNHFWQMSQAIILVSYVAGIWHVQKRWMTRWTSPALSTSLAVERGNLSSACFSRHLIRCERILLWSNWSFLRFSPLAAWNAKAAANKPQSTPPTCCCTGTTVTTNALSCDIGLNICDSTLGVNLLPHLLS